MAIIVKKVSLHIYIRRCIVPSEDQRRAINKLKNLCDRYY